MPLQRNVKNIIMALLGRKKEQIILQQLVEVEKSDFLVLYGRRRVGKTFLIKEYCNQNFLFYMGLKNTTKKEQLANFNTSLSFYGKMPYPKVNSWIVKNLLNNRGGLHNRVTRRMHISPFTLSECEAFFQYKKIHFDRKSIIDAYMIFGGIPFYLEMFEKGLSVAQNIDNLIYKEDAPLKNEFDFLYASLFKNYESHIKIIETLSTKAKGLTREEIIAASKISNGGGLSTMLEELEQCDFIRKYKSFGKKEQQSLYQLTDFYSLFYYNFLKNN
jgi:predicted AAA+ superfamily ATPase